MTNAIFNNVIDRFNIHKLNIRDISKEYGLDPYLVAAICWQESGFLSHSSAYEDEFYKRYIRNRSKTFLKRLYPKLGDDIEIEKRQLATSWGLMQVMGETARELGFRGELKELYNSDGLKYGCLYLCDRIKIYHQIDTVLSAYNAGTPTAKNRDLYVVPVLNKQEILKEEKVVIECFGK